MAETLQSMIEEAARRRVLAETVSGLSESESFEVLAATRAPGGRSPWARLLTEADLPAGPAAAAAAEAPAAASKLLDVPRSPTPLAEMSSGELAAQVRRFVSEVSPEPSHPIHEVTPEPAGTFVDETGSVEAKVDGLMATLGFR